MCTDPFLCRGSSESCVVDISFHLIKIRLKIAAASAAVPGWPFARGPGGHAPRAGIAACGYRYRNARLQLPTPLAVTPVSHSRRTRGDISGIPSSDSNLHDFAFRLSDFSASRTPHLRPRSRLARPAGPDRAAPRVPRADGVQSGRGGKSVTARHARYTQTHVHRDRHRQVTRRP